MPRLEPGCEGQHTWLQYEVDSAGATRKFPVLRHHAEMAVHAAAAERSRHGVGSGAMTETEPDDDTPGLPRKYRGAESLSAWLKEHPEVFEKDLPGSVFDRLPPGALDLPDLPVFEPDRTPAEQLTALTELVAAQEALLRHQQAEAVRVAAAEVERDRHETRRFRINTGLTIAGLVASIVAAWAAVVVLNQ